MRHHFGCPKPVNEVVYPTKYNVVNNCFENEVKHVHPSHTTVVNHHLQKNKHVYPHSTSVENTFNSVDVYGGAYNVPRPPAPTAQGGTMAGGPPRPPQGPMGGPRPPVGYPGANPYFRR
ncbi:CotD family spore coat protein [Aquibacillus saliphilus]|uniref:CotD family spore coat protein n=1 Tax=Aquibacillus saliphilus TaxID=1909422 RepID=UPI001CF0688B|nr:CotD family spore coat protein [Aquibacillus saliphilus]